MALDITDEELDLETARQAKVIFPLIKRQMHGTEQIAVDFGCGAGRFTPHLNNLLNATQSITVGFDPCRELIAEAPTNISGVSWESMNTELFFFRNQDVFDIAFTAMVFCLPHVNVETTTEGLADVLAPNGLMVLVDHMTEQQPEGRWAQFRPESFYITLFARYGITLTKVGEDHQLSNPITILCGRKI